MKELYRRWCRRDVESIQTMWMHLRLATSWIRTIPPSQFPSKYAWSVTPTSASHVSSTDTSMTTSLSTNKRRYLRSSLQRWWARRPLATRQSKSSCRYGTRRELNNTAALQSYIIRRPLSSFLSTRWMTMRVSTSWIIGRMRSMTMRMLTPSSSWSVPRATTSMTMRWSQSRMDRLTLARSVQSSSWLRPKITQGSPRCFRSQPSCVLSTWSYATMSM